MYTHAQNQMTIQCPSLYDCQLKISLTSRKKVNFISQYFQQEVKSELGNPHLLSQMASSLHSINLTIPVSAIPCSHLSSSSTIFSVKIKMYFPYENIPCTSVSICSACISSLQSDRQPRQRKVQVFLTTNLALGFQHYRRSTIEWLNPTSNMLQSLIESQANKQALLIDNSYEKIISKI